MNQRTCDQLGVCKGLTPPCAGCTQRLQQPAFAPGVIEHHGPKHGKHLVRWMVRALCLSALAALVGYLNGGAL